MRLFWFLALWTERDAGGFQAIVGTAHITLGFRGLFLWYCHCLNVSLKTGVSGFDYFSEELLFIWVQVSCYSLNHCLVILKLITSISTFDFKLFQSCQASMKNRWFTITAALIQVVATNRAKPQTRFLTQGLLWQSHDNFLSNIRL